MYTEMYNSYLIKIPVKNILLYIHANCSGYNLKFSNILNEFFKVVKEKFYI